MVASNGINGLCIEHSVAEGIVIINMSEYVLDYVQKNRFNYNVSVGHIVNTDYNYSKERILSILKKAWKTEVKKTF